MGNYWLGSVHSVNEYILKITKDYNHKMFYKMQLLDPVALCNLPGVSIETMENRERHERIERNRSIYVHAHVPLVVSTYDGEYCTLYYDMNPPKSMFCNLQGRARYNLPVNRDFETRISEINKDQMTLNKIKVKLDAFDKSNALSGESMKINSILLAGELFANIEKKEGKSRFFDFLSLSIDPKEIGDLNKINYEIFDIISINYLDVLDLSYENRLEILNCLFPSGIEEAKKKEEISIFYSKKLEKELDLLESLKRTSRINVIKHLTNVRADSLHYFFSKWVKNGQNESMMIWDNSDQVFKAKMIQYLYGIIIGDIGGERLIALMREDGSYQILGTVLYGFEGLVNPYRSNFYYLNKSRSRRSIKFTLVEPKEVIEIRYFDIITEGDTMLKMVLEFNPNNNKWIVKGYAPFVSLLFPNYDSKNTSKKPIYEDTKIEQISDHIKYIEILSNWSDSSFAFPIQGIKWVGHHYLGEFHAHFKKGEDNGRHSFYSDWDRQIKEDYSLFDRPLKRKKVKK